MYIAYQMEDPGKRNRLSLRIGLILHYALIISHTRVWDFGIEARNYPYTLGSRTLSTGTVRDSNHGHRL
jgi:hypothetical protein